MIPIHSPNKQPSAECRLVVLNAVHYAPGDKIRDRIKNAAKQHYTDPVTGRQFKFTWRTISTWLYRFKKNGITTLENKTRSDKNQHRKISPSQLAEAIHEVLPSIEPNKVGKSLKSAVYRLIQEKGLISRKQCAQTTFYRMVREHGLMDSEVTDKLRQSFAMKYANELWQADTMYGPSLKQHDGSYKKTFLIAFIDDASRVITHAEWFYNDNTENTIQAFKSALYKRGKPERLYLDNGSNYKSNEIAKACLRLDIALCHTPIRDGAAKGKIERFFRGFRDRFLTIHHDFISIQHMNELTQNWIENEYNAKPHSSIQMTPIDRFNLDRDRIEYLVDDPYSDEVFFIEEDRVVSKTNLIAIHNTYQECPADLRGKKVQVRFNRTKRNPYIIYYKDQRMGETTPLDLYHNSKAIR